ncbi:hypothetical protein [Actinoplanes sp. NPDC049118]|uniref:hypothetical protein n=1 Tax=Actinoplanes sp. NPDC049118 TaxID=3155769 RepID=UPI00340FCF4C
MELERLVVARAVIATRSRRRHPHLSAWYMEIHRLGGMWVGDDENLVLDLATDRAITLR